MGQAKQRGTFEQRKAKAEERNREIAKALAEYEATRPKAKEASPTTVAILGLLASVKGGAA